MICPVALFPTVETSTIISLPWRCLIVLVGCWGRKARCLVVLALILISFLLVALTVLLLVLMLTLMLVTLLELLGWFA